MLRKAKAECRGLNHSWGTFSWTGAVKSAEQMLLHLASRRPGEVGDIFEALRHLVGGQTRAAEGVEIALGGSPSALREQDVGAADLAPLVVRPRQDGGFRHRGMGGKDVLDLGRIDILAAGNEHLLPAAGDIIIAASVAAILFQ